MNGRFPIGGTGNGDSVNIDNDTIMKNADGIIEVPTSKGIYRGTILIDNTVADGGATAYQLTLCKTQPLVDGDVIIAQAISVSNDITEHQISEFQLDYVSTYTHISQGSEQTSVVALSDESLDYGISTYSNDISNNGGKESITHTYSDLTLNVGYQISFMLSSSNGYADIEITFTHYGCTMSVIVNGECDSRTYMISNGGSSNTETYTINVSNYDESPIIIRSDNGIMSSGGSINITKIVVSGLYSPDIYDMTSPSPISSSSDSGEESGGNEEGSSNTTYTFVQLSDVNVIKAPFVYTFVYLDGKLYGSAQSSTTLSNVPQSTVGAIWYE